MNPPDDKAWEARIDQALKGLPELAAPRDLVARTLIALERRQKPAWHQRPWTMWPVWLRVASLVFMLGIFGAVCVAKWEIAHTTWGSALVDRFTHQFANWGAVVNAADTIGRAAVTVAHHLNGWVALGCLVMATSAYLACIGLGTAAARLTLVRRAA